MTLSRRSVLTGLSAGAATTVLGVAATPSYAASVHADPFTLGVASGDPRPDGVTLWTRLAPEPLAPDFGMSPGGVRVQWQVATDERMNDVVRSGTARAEAGGAHSVHVDVRGLEPDRYYWYRFRVGRYLSPVGRTRTFPAEGSAISSLSFATLSCQSITAGRFAALGSLAERELDVVLHLGDYIYEAAGPADPAAGADRRHRPFRVCRTLEDYRIRHTQYRLDPNLQAAHAAHPFVVVPDDHEVANNFNEEIPVNGRKAAGFQAYWEHMPLPASSQPSGASMPLFRSMSYGSLASFSMLDTRQYRSVQIDGPTFQELPEAAFDPTRTLTGGRQEQWLFDRLSSSDATWNILAQQVYLAAIDMAPGGGTAFNTDKWDGYPIARERLTRFLAEAKPNNPISVAGDVHAAMVNDITLTHDPSSKIVASEFLGSSISSQKGNNALFEAALPENPQMRYYNGAERGYLTCEVTPETFRGDLWFVDDPFDDGSSVRRRTSYAVDAGTLGAHPA